MLKSSPKHKAGVLEESGVVEVVEAEGVEQDMLCGTWPHYTVGCMAKVVVI